MKVIIVKEVMKGDFSPVAMFRNMILTEIQITIKRKSGMVSNYRLTTVTLNGYKITKYKITNKATIIKCCKMSTYCHQKQLCNYYAAWSAGRGNGISNVYNVASKECQEGGI